MGLNRFDISPVLYGSRFNVVERLKVHPELRTGIQKTADLDRSLRSHGSLALDDLANSCLRKPRTLGETIYRYTHGDQELFLQHLSGMDILQMFHGTSLMIINDFNIGGVSGLPTKTDAPFLVDADAPLPFSLAVKRLQPVTRWYVQGLKRCDGCDHPEFSARDVMKPIRKPDLL